MAEAVGKGAPGTTPCRFYASGRCAYGEACRFFHDLSLVVPQRPPQSKESYGLNSQDRPDFANWENLPSCMGMPMLPMGMPMPAACLFYASGRCPNGDSCCFVHDAAGAGGRQRKPERIKVAADVASLADVVPKDAAVLRETYRRLTEAVYRHWCPEKLDRVPAIMAKYGGLEGDVYQKAVQLYVFTQDRRHWAPLIRGMYERFNPAKLKDFDQVLEKYRDNETELFKALCERYIPTLSRDDSPLELYDWGASSSQRERGAGRGTEAQYSDELSAASMSSAEPDRLGGRRPGAGAGASVRPLASQNSLVVGAASESSGGHGAVRRAAAAWAERDIYREGRAGQQVEAAPGDAPALRAALAARGDARPRDSSRDGEWKRRRHSGRREDLQHCQRSRAGSAPEAVRTVALARDGSRSPVYGSPGRADPLQGQRPEPRAKLVRRGAGTSRDLRPPPLRPGDPVRPPGSFNSLNDE